MVRYQQGEYEAFSELYARHSGKVYAYLRSHLSGQSTSADDILQTAFLKLHEARSKYDKTYPFLPWLFSITRNAMIDSLRKKSPTPVDSRDLERLVDASAVVDGEPTEADLEATLASLPKDQKELIQMRFKEGLSFEEISDRLGVTQPTIRKRVSRAIQSARKIFGGQYGKG